MMRPCRILFFSAVNHARKSPKVIHFAQWLSLQGHSVGIVTLERPSWLHDDSITVYPMRERDLPEIARYLYWGLRLYRTCIRYRPNILVAVNDPGALVGAWVSALTGVPLVLLAQERTNLDMASFKRRLLARHYRRARLVFETSPEAAQLRQSLMGLREPCPCFLNVPPLRPASPVRESGADRNEPLSIVYTGFVGRASFPLELVRAVAQVRDRVTLSIYGQRESQHLEDLERECRSLGLEGVVRFKGSVDREQVFDILEESDIGAVLYQSGPETGYNLSLCSPNKLFEYASVGLPVLASDQATLRSWVGGQDIGVCVNPGDPDSIADGIRRLIDPARLAAMRRNAFRTHREAWNMEQEAAKAWRTIAAILPNEQLSLAPGAGVR